MKNDVKYVCFSLHGNLHLFCVVSLRWTILPPKRVHADTTQSLDKASEGTRLIAPRRQQSRAMHKLTGFDDEYDNLLPEAWGEQTHLLSAEKRLDELDHMIETGTEERESLRFQIKCMKNREHTAELIDTNQEAPVDKVPCTCQVMRSVPCPVVSLCQTKHLRC